MFKKALLSVVAVMVLVLPAGAGAYHYYYADSGYYTTTYETREVSEYVPYRKYVCDESHYPDYHDYGYYGYGYENYRNCYYKTDYRLETKTVRVPVKRYVDNRYYVQPTHTRRVYDVPTHYSNVDRYDRYYEQNGTYYPRNTRNIVNYYGYYYDI